MKISHKKRRGRRRRPEPHKDHRPKRVDQDARRKKIDIRQRDERRLAAHQGE